MPFLDHVRLANELVDATRPLWKPEEVMIFPAMHSVILHVCEGASGGCDDPSRNARVCQFPFIAGLI